MAHRRLVAWLTTVLASTLVAWVAGCNAESSSAPNAAPSGTPTPTVLATASPSQDLFPTAAPGLSVPTHSVVAIEAATGNVLDVIPVGPDPKLIATASGQVWTLNLGDGGMSRIDPTTHGVASVRVDGDAVGMASDGDTIWVTHDGRFLTQLDGSTGDPVSSVGLAKAPIFALRDAGFLAVADGTAWLTVPVLGHFRSPQSLWEVEVASGKTRSTYPLSPDPLTPIVSDGAVWVPVLGSNGVVRLDLETRLADIIRLREIAVGVAAGEGAIWAVREFSGSMVRLAPTDGSIVAEIKLGWRGRGVAVGGGSVWAATEGGVTEIDPGTNLVKRVIPLMDQVLHGLGPSALTYLDGMVWVAVE